MPSSCGSAAVEETTEAPLSAVSEVVARVAARLSHTARIAGLAANGHDPIVGAEFILDTLDDLADDLAQLHRVRQ